MRLPRRVPTTHPSRKIAAAVLLAALAAALGLGARHAPGLSVAIIKANEVLYDTLYRLRPVEDRTDGSVVIVAVDQKSLDAMDQAKGFGWPWPREFWGNFVTYFEKCGARAVAFDLVFTEKSVHADEFDDDTTFGKLVNDSKVPAVFAAMIAEDGSPGRFAPKVDRPVFGAINIVTDDVFRNYPPIVNGRASLARQALIAANALPADSITTPFLLHYYGPHRTPDGRFTFRYLSAAAVIAAALGEEGSGVDASMFKDKIVP